jgi:hypothetical protein
MKNPKTTLAGILGGLLILLGPSVGARLQGDMTQPPITFQSVATAAAVVVIGKLAADGQKKKEG